MHLKSLLNDMERYALMKKRWVIALICMGAIWLSACAIDSGNEKEHMPGTSEKWEGVADAESSQEEPHKPEEQKDYDIWEIEHVWEIGFGQNEHITQDDVDRIGRFIHLKRLKLSIDESGIDLSLLESLVELESLDMDIRDGCSPDLSFMASLTQLENLNITVGSDVNLEPLGSLVGLRQLSVSTWSGDAPDLSFLKKLSCIEKVIIAKCCAVSDLSMFQNMSSMRELDVAYVEDGDLRPLSNLENLESLSITGENIRNPEGLGNLKRLKSLSLYDNSSEAMYGETERVPFDVQSIANMTELEWLDLVYLYVEDISPLENLKSLRHIGLIKTNVRDILPLAGLEKLDEIHIFGNNSELVKEQAESYFDKVGNMIVTEEIPNGL